MAAVSKDALLTKRLPEQDVEIPGVGAVRVRSLTRAEVLAIRSRPIAVDEMERVLLEAAMVAPKLTAAEVLKWQESVSAGELEPITRAIAVLSGLDDSAAKEAVKQFRG